MRSQPSIAPSHKVRWAQMVFTHPTCVPHMFCAKHLTTPTTRSRTFYKWRKQILGNSFHAPVNISQMGGAPPPARVSNGASGGFYRCCPKGRFGRAGSLFTEDVVSLSDGGGVVRAARVPVVGRERVAKFIASFSSHFWSGVTLSWIEVNGQEAVLISTYEEPVGLVTRDASEQGIHKIMWVMRPSKRSAISLPRLNIARQQHIG
jgi:hypothetical protein